jgi:hypothetical protein
MELEVHNDNAEDHTGGGEDLGISDNPESSSDHDKDYSSDNGDEDLASSLDLASSSVAIPDRKCPLETIVPAPLVSSVGGDLKPTAKPSTDCPATTTAVTQSASAVHVESSAAKKVKAPEIRQTSNRHQFCTTCALDKAWKAGVAKYHWKLGRNSVAYKFLYLHWSVFVASPPPPG